MRRISALIFSASVALGCGDDGGSGDDNTPAGSSGTSNSPTTTNPGDSGDPPGTTQSSDPTTDATTNADTGDTTADPGDSTSELTTTGVEEPLPPTNGAELVPWLEAGEYLGWTGESGVHDSSGPHFGGVRTYVNTVLLDSLEAGNAQHPIDAAAVKELYGEGGTVLGYSVTVKIQDDSAGGNGWYWYEDFEGTVYADGIGDGLCTGCHGDGQDFFRSPYPLQ